MLPRLSDTGDGIARQAHPPAIPPLARTYKLSLGLYST
jgi:hypothetical protein